VDGNFWAGHALCALFRHRIKRCRRLFSRWKPAALPDNVAAPVFSGGRFPSETRAFVAAAMAVLVKYFTENELAGTKQKQMAAIASHADPERAMIIGLRVVEE
jgi:hypothetical protein